MFRNVDVDVDVDDAAQPAESPEGVDLTLISWMLSLTPPERVERIESIAQSLQELQELNRER